MFEYIPADISRQHRIRIEEAKLITNELQISDSIKILKVGCGSGVQAAPSHYSLGHVDKGLSTILYVT